MPPVAIRVVKLGGSLLDWPRLCSELQRWLTQQPPAMNVVIVGGGEFAEEVRRLDGIHQLSSRDAHWLAAETMQITAKLVAIMLTNSNKISRFDELLVAGQACEPQNGIAVLDSLHFLRSIEPHLPGKRLPESWDTTSDSIAARVAVALDAEELVLIKSTLLKGLNQPLSIAELAAAEYVDAALPNVAAGLKRLRYVNLRDATFAECVIEMQIR